MPENKERNLDKEYSPSQWSRRYASKEETISQHFAFVRKESEVCRYRFKHELGVPYGDGDREKFDVYGVNLPSDAPVFVYIHGGYWRALSREECAHSVAPLVRAGCRVIIVGYDLCPQITLENLCGQIHLAINGILKYAKNLGASSVNFAGHSAGAHLLLCGLTKEFFDKIPHREIIKNIYLLSGVFDVREIKDIPTVNENNMFSLYDNNVEKLSPVLQNFVHLKDMANLKFHVIVADHESSTYRDMSQRMYEVLKEVLQHTTFTVMTGLDHFNLVEKLSEDDYELVLKIIQEM